MLHSQLMANSDDDPFKPQALHPTLALHSNGRVQHSFTVACSRRGHTISVEVCKSCPRFATLRAPRPGRQGVLYCTIGTDVHTTTSTTVADIMNRDLVSVHADVDLDSATRLLVGLGVSALPVIDSSGTPTGVVSALDLLRTPRSPASVTVSNIITAPTHSLRETADAHSAATLMATEATTCLPVVNPDGLLVGVVTPVELARWALTLTPEPH